MFTQCPKCQSVFMVSEKDVKAHEGLVRCGNCYSVFNSSWNLTEDPRDDFVEELMTKETPGDLGSSFTFSIMDSTAETDVGSGNVVTQPDEEKPVAVASAEELLDEKIDESPPVADLEPFPEPEIGDFENTLPTSDSSSTPDSLLYFDANTDDSDLTPGDDPSLLQTPSISNEVPTFDQDNSDLTPDIKIESEETLVSDESMWPGGDEKLENESVLEQPVRDIDVSSENVAVSRKSNEEIDENTSGVEQLDDAPVTQIPASENPPDTPHAVEIRVDAGPLLSPEIENDQEPGEPVLGALSGDSVSPENEGDHWLDDIVSEAENIEGMPVLKMGDSGSSSGAAKNSGGDDTFYAEGETKDADEFFSIDALPNSTDEDLSNKKKGSDAGDSVFITSEEEKADDSYVPISLKKGRKDELFHGLDDFPEPGELSALNYEDTMEINAMLEEANISKEQIESALSAAEITDDDDEDTDEVALSSGDGLTDALFPSSEASSGNTGENRRRRKVPSNSIVKLFKNLVPALGSKKILQEPQAVDDQTQLIKSLYRSNAKAGLPVWVSKYTMPITISLLTVLLLAQIGYFYMDKLVRITPLRPLLESGCMVAGCTVPEVQNIDEIQQLSSQLTPLSDENGGFKVSSILVNRGIRSQLFPALELILTDRAGNMISRRVVTSDMYLEGGRVNTMKPNEAVDIGIRFQTPSIRVDGFELRPVSQNWLD